MFPLLLFSAQVKIAVFDSGPGHPHEKQVIGFLTKQLKRVCGSGWEIQSYPIYDLKGNLSESKFLDALRKARSKKADVFHFSWNFPYEEGFRQGVELISQSVSVFAAGENPADKNLPLPLKQTVAGKTAGAFIVGELDGRGYLAPRSNHGPEMFTALRSVEGHPGSSFTATAFTARLACALRNSQDRAELFAELKKRKLKSLDQFPGLEMLFKGFDR